MSQIPSPYPTPSPPPPPSSSYTWLWILLVILLVLGLMCAGLCGGLFYLGTRAVQNVQQVVREGFESAAPYLAAVERVRTDREVISRLGELIQPGPPRRFNIRENGPSGTAEFEYEISGAQGKKANVLAEAEKAAGQWSFRVLNVTFEDGQTIDLAKEDGLIPLE